MTTQHITFEQDKKDDKETNRNIDREFDNWLKANPSGFYLNQKSQTYYILHRVNCWHLHGFEELVDLTNKAKICSTDRKVLEQWISDDKTKNFAYCETCDPQGPIDNNDISYDYDD